MTMISLRARERRAEGVHARTAAVRPTAIQREWLKRGLNQPGGKLPLFDRDGQLYPERTIRSCIEHGWAEPWFHNPIDPSWLVCKLTEAGRKVVAQR